MKISDIMDFFCNVFLIEALHNEAKYIMKELADEKHNLPIKIALHKYRPTYILENIFWKMVVVRDTRFQFHTDPCSVVIKVY